MRKPQVIRATGLGHPEGPCELDDGRVLYANTYRSEIGYWDPKTNQQGQYAFVGGGPNACILGSDGAIYSTQTPTVGKWSAPEYRPPSIQKIGADGKVEVIVTHADGIKLDGPNDLAFGPDGMLYFTDSGDWDPDNKPHLGRICAVGKDGTARILEELDHVYPNGIVAEPDGSIVWVESYSRNVVRRKPNGQKTVQCQMPADHVPDGLKLDINGDLWIAAVAAGGVDHFTRDGAHVDFLDTGGTILNCVFGRGGKLFCCDMGPYDMVGAGMSGTLLEVDLGIEGMPLYRGTIG